MGWTEEEDPVGWRGAEALAHAGERRKSGKRLRAKPEVSPSLLPANVIAPVSGALPFLQWFFIAIEQVRFGFGTWLGRGCCF